MSFANLKKQSKLGSLTAKLVKEVEKMKWDYVYDENEGRRVRTMSAYDIQVEMGINFNDYNLEN